MTADIGLILPEQLDWTGVELHRPECILTTPSETLHVSDHRGGILQIDAESAQRLIQPCSGAIPETFMPNGFALDRQGGYIIANLGESDGVYRLTPDGGHVAATSKPATPACWATWQVLPSAVRIYARSISDRCSPIGSRHSAHLSRVSRPRIGIGERFRIDGGDNSHGPTQESAHHRGWYPRWVSSRGDLYSHRAQD